MSRKELGQGIRCVGRGVRRVELNGCSVTERGEVCCIERREGLRREGGECFVASKIEFIASKEERFVASRIGG